MWDLTVVFFIIASLICTVFTFPASLLKEAQVSSGYESCPQGEDGMLNVHLVCHTHDDVGWLKTVDEYYYGGNQSIQRASVQYIIDSVIQSLVHDQSKKRKFIYVETAFFWRWWNQQDDATRHIVKNLACSGQLEFIGGGWSMNDEAATHYNSIIDQMTWGLRILNDTFGSCGVPKVAWQIDPFGHSREQASLFAQMYFDGLFFGRLDYQDKDQRAQTKTMEHVWKASPNLGPAANLFTGALFNSYSPPPGFCFDLLCDDEPIMDDPRLKGYNVDQRVSDFIAQVKDQAQYYATNHIIMTMGNDFNYQAASPWFKNLDKLIFHVNQRKQNGSKVNVFYSTPSCYLYALNRANQTWKTKSDDFLPYASDPHAYWTGYFTSRPSLKRFERTGNNKLQVCKQLTSLTDLDDFDVTMLRRAMGIVQHHDAITGTAKQHVTNDYAQTLTEAISSCQSATNDAYQKLMALNSSEPPTQIFCNFLNISQCNMTEGSNPVAVTVYNPLARPLSTYIRLPILGKAYKVYGPDGSAVNAQVISVPPSVFSIPGRLSKAKSELVFQTDLPPLGYSTYLVRSTPNKQLFEEQASKKVPVNDSTIENEFVQVVADGKTGLLRQMRFSDGTNLTITQSFYWYRAMNGNNSDFDFRASGAYIFRPNGTSPISLGTNVTVSVLKGPLVQEIQQTFAPWLSQIIRLYKGIDHVEFNWVVGPIPVDDGVGKEIITRFDTDMKTYGKFFTDSNGREILKRVKDYRPTWKLNVTEPISGNYYPVNSRIFLRDGSRRKQLTVLTDRSQGGSSIQNGSIELMIHRRLLHDDAFGVGEALNEPGVDGRGLVIRGTHYLLFNNITSAASKHRPLAQKILLQPELSFAIYNSSEAEFIKKFRTKYNGLKTPLPPNVHLLTMEPWKRGTKLLRFEHFFEFDDDPVLSKPATVVLKDLFTDFDIVSLTETTLSANQFLKDARRLVWNSGQSNDIFSAIRKPGADDKAVGDLVISLNPMQIRTFIAEVKYKNL